MIREARCGDKQEIFNLWKSCYPTQNEDYLKFYFQYIYDYGVSIVQEQDDQIISSLQMNYHVVSLLGKQLKCGYLLGASTLPDYRRRGHMHMLMDSMLDEAGHNCLLSFMKAFNPKAYAQFGFEVVYYRKAYTIPRDNLNKVSTTHVSSTTTAEELLHVYRQFMMRFDGGYVRDQRYYEMLLRELELKQKQLFVYRDAHHEVSGYCIVQVKKNETIVQEAVYMESAVLKRLLKKAMGSAQDITIMVSSNEHLEKIFPLSIPKKQAYMMARINNYELFNKLYNVKIHSIEEALRIIKKPLWCHEYY